MMLDPRGQEQVADRTVHVDAGSTGQAPSPPLWGDGGRLEGCSSPRALGAHLRPLQSTEDSRAGPSLLLPLSRHTGSRLCLLTALILT